MIFKMGADDLNIHVFYISHKDHGMRISHGDTGHLAVSSIDIDRYADHRIFLITYRDFLRIQYRLSHIYPNTGNFALFHQQIQVLDSRQSVHSHLRFIRQTIVVDIFSHTTNPVSTHFCLGTVRIVHIHPDICFL